MTYDELHDSISPALRQRLAAVLGPKFPVGGPREPVYAFLRQHGYVQSGTDKQWSHYRGRTLHLYGAGSMARITTGATGVLVVDGPLADAVHEAEAADDPTFAVMFPRARP